ncbi:MAG: hypothetical protein HOP03_15935 [Lysobacter sp.]|nr:hypothetical protein [Lysobacter sp.]
MAAAGLHATFNNIGSIVRDCACDFDGRRSCFEDIDNKLRANFPESMKSLISLRFQVFPQPDPQRTEYLSTRCACEPQSASTPGEAPQSLSDQGDTPALRRLERSRCAMSEKNRIRVQFHPPRDA